MSDNPFLKALDESVGQTNSLFDSADKDLHSRVALTAEAVTAFTKGQLRLSLVLMTDGQSGRLYDLDLNDKDSLIKTVASFLITARGYPIYYGRNEDNTLSSQGRLDSLEELDKYLYGVVSDPTSPLTIAIAFHMRPRPRE